MGVTINKERDVGTEAVPQHGTYKKCILERFAPEVPRNRRW